MNSPTSARIQFGFWDLDQRLNPDLRKSLEVFYYRIPCVSNASYPMLWDRNIDHLLNRAADHSEIEWLCVTAVGTLFPGQDQILDAVTREIESLSEPALIVGHIIEKPGKFPGVHEQMFLIHLPTFRKLNRPAFGGFEVGTRFLKNFVYDSILRAAEGSSKQKIWSCGWGLVHASLEAGLSVFEMSQDLRRQKVYAYPDDQIEKLNRNLELFYQMEDLDNPAQRRMLGYLFNKRFGLNPKYSGSAVNLLPRLPTVFMFNTEELLPKENHFRKSAAPLDFYFGPCAGFLELAALHAHGFNPSARVVYYDYNPASLMAKRRMLNEWDGDIATLQTTVQRIAADDPERHYHVGVFDLEIGKLMKVFGSPEALARAWSQLRELKKDFVELNLLTGHRALFERIGAAEHGVFAISDIFTGQNELTYGFSKMQNLYQEFCESALRFPNLIVSGKDDRGMPL